MEEQENLRVVFFEPYYELIKTNPNYVWTIYEKKLEKLSRDLAYFKNFDKDDLFQQSYLYFLEFCKSYDPYYNNCFFPFDRYMFKNMIMKLRAYIQRYYFKNKRETPSEFSEYLNQSGEFNDIRNSEGEMHLEYIYSLITPRQKEILELSLKGYKQQEIGKKLNISQSRVSVIKNKTMQKLRDIMEKEEE